MQHIHCAICGKKEKIQVLYPATFSYKKISKKTFSARRIPDRMHHQFVKCLRCGLVFSNPILNPSEIQKLYKSSSFHYGSESTYLKKTYGGYLQSILDKTKINSLLDIGCGNGFFLEEAKERGVIKIAGVEPGRASVAKARKDIKKYIKIDIFRKGLFKANSFNVVSCFHTLDHIIDPNAFLLSVLSVLKKKGKAIFIVHNTDGLSVKVFGERSPIFDIEHIFLFNKSNLRKIFQKNGFRVIYTFDVQNTYPLFYWFRMMPLPKRIKELLFNILKATYTETFPVGIYAGNIGILAEKI